MLKYFFKLLILLGFSLNAQNDSIPIYQDRYGLRAGVDLQRLSRSLYDNNYTGLELVGDFRYNERVYLAAELGNENKITNDDRFTFTTKGSYIKLGADINFYENWLDMDNQIYLGARYAFSTFSQALNSYKIYNTNPYFAENNFVESDKSWSGLTASWVEIVAGFRAETLKNVYLGFSFRINYLVTERSPEGFGNFFIPGFNRVYTGKFGVGFNYTLTYFLPLYKK